MKATATVVQLPTRKNAATLWLPVADADDIRGGPEGVVVPITVHLSVADADFLERFAAFRNALTDARGEMLKARLSRKSMAESLLTAQVAAMRRQVAEMEAELGPLPPKKPKDVAAKYGKRAKAWMDTNPPPARCSQCGSELKKR